MGPKEDPEKRQAGWPARPQRVLSRTESSALDSRPLAGTPFLRTAERTGSVWPTHNHYSWLCRPQTLHTAPGSTQKCELGLSQGSPS